MDWRIGPSDASAMDCASAPEESVMDPHIGPSDASAAVHQLPHRVIAS